MQGHGDTKRNIADIQLKYHGIYRITKALNIYPDYVCEVGPYYVSRCQSLPFIVEGCRALLVEPLLAAYSDLKDTLKAYGNVDIVNCAVCDENGEKRFVVTGKEFGDTGSSHLEHIDAPGKHEKTEKTITVQCRRFGELDSGKIDVLMADCEGAEWFVVEDMRSRPKLISLEMKSSGVGYVNPYTDKIEKWMSDNGYEYCCWNGDDKVWKRKD